MTHVQCCNAWHPVAAAALMLALAGLVGCAEGPARPGDGARGATEPFASAAPEHRCADFACEQ
jgi:hypothetical protein